MSRLRPSLAQALLRILENSPMGRANFDVVYPKSGQKLVRITLKGFPDFTFVIGEGGNSPVRLFVEESPGPVLKSEITGGIDLGEVIFHLQEWAARLPQELEAIRAPDNQDLERLLMRLESEIERNVRNPEGQFDISEMTELRGRLETLGQRFEKLESDHAITKIDLKELKRVLAQSNKDLPALPRGTWYRATVSKIVSVLKKIIGTKEGRELLATAAKKLMGLE